MVFEVTNIDNQIRLSYQTVPPVPLLHPHTLTGDRVPVYARLYRAHLHIVHAHHVLVIAVGRQPRDDRRRRGDVLRLDGRRPQVGGVAADDHRAGGIARRAPVLRETAYADAVRLDTKQTHTNV